MIPFVSSWLLLAVAPSEDAALLDLEARIADCDVLSQRRALASQYVQTAARAALDVPLAGLSRADQREIERQRAAARARDIDLQSVAGRYNLLLAPAVTAENLRNRSCVASLDAAYVLLRRLFGVDPVLQSRRRIVHSYDVAATRDDAITPDPTALRCAYAPPFWRIRDLDNGDDWREPFIREIARCFLAAGRGKNAIESLPDAREAWTCWAADYVFDHLPGRPRFTAARIAWRREAVRSLIADLRFNGGSFAAIAGGMPAAGLLYETLLPSDRRDLIDAFGPARKTLRALNSEIDSTLGGHAPLELLRFITFLENESGPTTLQSFRRCGLGVSRADTDAYRVWLSDFSPALTALSRAHADSTPASSPTQPLDTSASPPSNLSAILGTLDQIGDGGPFRRDLREQGLIALAEQLELLDRHDDARSVSLVRRWRLDWSFLGPFQVADDEDPLSRTFLDETARTRDALLLPHTPDADWINDLPRDHGPARNLNAHFRGKNGSVAYAFASINADKPQTLRLFLSAAAQARVFLNGRPLGGASSTTVNPATRISIPLNLQRGENSLLLKVSRGASEWGFHARLAPPLPDSP